MVEVVEERKEREERWSGVSSVCLTWIEVEERMSISSHILLY